MSANDSAPESLLISGIQHFMFCKHQWGLIHIESAWEENALTFEGSALHVRADNPEIKESRGNVFYSRSVPVRSLELNMNGVIDVIEYTQAANGLYVSEKGKSYTPRLIEYKRGSPKEGLEDKVQLAALAMAYSEMTGFAPDFGYIYYFQTNRREKVEFTEELKRMVRELAREMHGYYDAGVTPPPKKFKGCRNCSFYPTCSFGFGGRDASAYIDAVLGEL